MSSGQLTVLPNMLRGASTEGGEGSDALLRAVRLLEICPASLLKRIGLYDTPYKHKTPEARGARKRILEAAELGLAPAKHGAHSVRVTMSPQLREVVLAQSGGDALDAVCSWIPSTLPKPPHSVECLRLLIWRVPRSTCLAAYAPHWPA